MKLVRAQLRRGRLYHFLREQIRMVGAFDLYLCSMKVEQEKQMEEII